MKPTNILNMPSSFWILRDDRGLFYAYSRNDCGVRCTEQIRLARKYETRKGATVAALNLRQAYGKLTEPVSYSITYAPTK